MLALVAWLLLQQPSCDVRAPDCAAYLSHLEWASTADADSVWQSLRFVATSPEADQWFALTDAGARRLFLETFWQRRARAAGVYAYERYAEHVRRLDKALRWFYAPAGPRMIGAWATPAWYDSVKVVLVPAGRDPAAYPLPLDDRGVIFMRMGEPQHVDRCSFAHRGEVWLYHATAAEPERTIILAPRGRDRGLQLVTSLAQMGCNQTDGRALAQRLSHYRPQFHLAQVYDWYGGSDVGIIATMLEDALISTWVPALTEEFARESRQVAAGEADAHQTIHSDRFRRTYATQLAAAFEFLHFDTRRDNAGEVTLTMAAPARQLRIADSDDYRFRVFLSYLDSAGHIIARRDTTRVFQLRQLPPPGALVETHVRTIIPSGAYEYVLRMEGGAASSAERAKESPTIPPISPGSGALARGRIVVPDFEPGALHVSSIALGRPSPLRSAWRRGDVALALMPTHLVNGDRQVSLYYELYGASAERAYETEITLQSGQDDERNARNFYVVRFPEDAGSIRSGTLAARRLIDLADLQQGYYRLTVRVSENGPAARSASMQTVVIVR